MKRENLSSGAQWEAHVGYSRAVKIGNTIEVSGTVATDGNSVLFPGDAEQQTKFILNKIKTTLESLGASLADVIRTRMYVVNIEEWEQIGSVHGDFFKNIRPATTMVEVSRLIDPGYLVEIEASAIIDAD
ncbi:RidA family protein [Portibacter lacus]|nr:RidA family protein [Portibacter lacus]